jgi:hypothetical protein
LYDLKELTLYVTENDIAQIVEHLSATEHCEFACCVWRNDAWTVEEMTVGSVKKLRAADRYLYIHAMPQRINIPQSCVKLKTEAAFWKREEIIRISPPLNMVFPTRGQSGVVGGGSPLPARTLALLYYIHFATEFVENEKPVPKSQAFVDATTRLLTWLGKEFVSWRCPRCFDNPDELVRVFGNRFQKKKEH